VPGPIVLDRSAAALARWLAALPAPAYDLRLVPAGGDGPVLCRHLDATGVVAALPWVKARNAAGFHAYCRPTPARHVLVDDLGPAALDAIAAAHRIAALVETSEANFQAWITLAGSDVPPALAGAAARLLASRFGGDPGAAGAAQLGRLVGTTNRKEKHRRRGDGAFPFVLLRGARGGVDPAGAALLAEAAPLVRPAAAAAAPVAAAEPAPSLPGDAAPEAARREAAEAARRVALALPPGARLDRSRLDHAAARRLLSRGAGPAFARAAVLAGERARAMPATAAAAYAARTVDAAARSLEGAGAADRWLKD
jgi:hypothetical protein